MAATDSRRTPQPRADRARCQEPQQGLGGFTRAVTGSDSRAEAVAASGWEAREGTVAAIPVSGDRAQAGRAEAAEEKQQVMPDLRPRNERTTPPHPTPRRPTRGQPVSRCRHFRQARGGPERVRAPPWPHGPPQTRPCGTQGQTCFASGPWSGVREGAAPPASVRCGTRPPSPDVEAGTSGTCPGQPASDDLPWVGPVSVVFFFS